MVRSEGMPTFRRGLEGYGHLFVQFDIKFPLNMNLLEHKRTYNERKADVMKRDKKAQKQYEEAQRLKEKHRYDDKLVTLRRFLKQSNVPLPKKSPRQELEDEIARIEAMKNILLDDLEGLKSELVDLDSKMDIDQKAILLEDHDNLDSTINYDGVTEAQQPPPIVTLPEQISYRDLVEPDPRATREHGATGEDEEEEGGHPGGERVQCASQ